MAVLRELGIECRYVASDSISHIWLAVKIDGEWYHSDVTWDDPPRLEGSGERSRAHLLFSDEKADMDGYTDRYGAADIKCESKRYDGEELISDIPFCTLPGDIDHNGRISLYDLLLVRQYLEGECFGAHEVCRICADVDGNFEIDGTDAEYIRRAILEISS